MYWTVSLDTMNKNQHPVRMFTLVYFPAVVTTLAYMMIYEAMEKSVKEGKIRVSVARFRNQNCVDCMDKIRSMFVVLFFISQLLMTFSLHQTWIELGAYAIYSGILIGILVIIFNGNQIAIYFKYAGEPYKSAKHYKYTK